MHRSTFHLHLFSSFLLIASHFLLRLSPLSIHLSPFSSPPSFLLPSFLIPLLRFHFHFYLHLRLRHRLHLILFLRHTSPPPSRRRVSFRSQTTGSCRNFLRFCNFSSRPCRLTRTGIMFGLHWFPVRLSPRSSGRLRGRETRPSCWTTGEGGRGVRMGGSERVGAEEGKREVMGDAHTKRKPCLVLKNI